jgi:hypothetical protein
LLIIGGCLAILPVFGLWMFPLGLMLLADDIPPLRRFRDRALDWLERRRPHWFAAAGSARGTEAPRAEWSAGFDNNLLRKIRSKAMLAS